MSDIMKIIDERERQKKKTKTERRKGVTYLSEVWYLSEVRFCPVNM